MEFVALLRPIQLRYNRTVSMFGFDQVHEYVLKLVDAEECPMMDENCPEADRLDITRCFSGKRTFLLIPSFRSATADGFF